MPCQLPDIGPVSASPSPMTQAATRSGLSKTRPEGVDQGVAELAALVDGPGVGTLTWLGTPPGVENWWNSRWMPRASWVMWG